MSASHLCIPRKKLLFPKQNYNALSPSSYNHISVIDLYISRIAHRHMNVEIGTEAAQFPEKEYINGIFVECTVCADTRQGLYHRERILKTSTLSCNEEKEEITKPPTR
jgi:hypothetical protein